jgi:stage V sporulation protein G
VVRDLKIIEGGSGPFVAMPSRKLTAHCPQCHTKNHLRAQHCNQCGTRLNSDKLPLDADGRAKLYADIAHPINSSCREMIQEHVIQEFFEELERAKEPGYISRYDDFDVEYGDAKQSVSTRSASTRFDKPHEQRTGHAPHAGGSGQQQSDQPQQPATPSRSTSHRSNEKSHGGFGAGIFED